MKQKGSVKDNSAMNALVSNAGLNAFIQRVYKTSGAGLLGALTTSQIVMSSGIVYKHPFACGIVGLISCLGGFFGAGRMVPD